MERAREQLLFFSGQSLNQKYEYENIYGKGETQEESCYEVFLLWCKWKFLGET